MRMYVCMCHSAHADLYVYIYIYMQGPRQEQEREGPRQEGEGPRQEQEREGRGRGKGAEGRGRAKAQIGPETMPLGLLGSFFEPFFESLGPSWTKPTKTGPFCRPNHASGDSKSNFPERTTLKVNADTSRVLHFSVFV